MSTNATGYPLVLQNMSRVRCVVVGGGAVAERKVRDLLAGGARPWVVSPQLTPLLAGWRDAGRIEHIPRLYAQGDLRGAFLSIAATDDPAINAAVAAEGEQRGVLVNVADDAAAGSFHTVATVRRGDLLLTVSTGGGSPTLSATIRRELEARYGPEYGILLGYLRDLRSGAAGRLSAQQRAVLWRRLTSERVVSWLREGALERFERYVCTVLDELQAEQGSA